MTRRAAQPPVLFTPGPTRVAESIREEMARPAISHRGEEARELIREVSDGCARLLGTRQTILLSTSSATGLMEAAVRNCVPRRALCLVAGAFSERWAVIVESCGREAIRHQVEWGRALQPAAVERALARQPVDAVTLVHNETSTGVAHPLAEIAAVVRRYPDVQFLVDAVSSLGGLPIEVDAVGTDVCLAGVQKALALPPGFALCSVSEEALARSAAATDKGFYFDFVRMRDAAVRHQALTTPSLPHLFALRAQLRRIFAEGLEARWRRHRLMGERARAWARERFALFAEAGFESDTVTCIETGDRVDAGALTAGLRDEGFFLSAGYGKLRHRTFRIGHMGEHTPADVETLLAATDRVIAAMGRTTP